jgi:hypothetical protein
MPFTFTSTGGSGEGTPGKDSLFLGTWNSVTAFLAVHQGGPVGLADGDWWAFVKDNANPNKIYVVREDPTSATGWVIDDNEHFVLPEGGVPGADALWNFTGPWANGIDYAAGSVVEFQGSTYYHPNGQFSSYSPPTNGWILVAEKGEPGTDVFAEDGTLYGPTNFGALKVLGLINSGDNDLGLYANDANIILQTADGKVDIVAPEVNIVSNVVPSSFN